ncbi:hypothetical protein GF312_12385 [Candidatus Poribacteria bacterium]|nr:hypothetical protein [Candidatus Poribacteria bacterium]
MIHDIKISAVICFMLPIYAAYPNENIPSDFPKFIIPENSQSMESLRELYYLHYIPGGPMATLWDEWLSGSTLWPGVSTDNRMESIRKRWSNALSARRIDPEGYVATHQHASIAHQDGWPFPFWKQGGPGTWGWHFSLQGVPGGWHGTEEKTQEGWTLKGGKDKGISDNAWNINLSSSDTYIRTSELSILPDQSPFIQLRWRAKDLGNTQPYLEWITREEPEYTSDKRFYFEPVDSQDIIYTMIPVFKSPAWKGEIIQLGINFGETSESASVGIQALFTQYDTRHNINNQNFIRGCCQYFWWTRDLNFLRENLNRMRIALLYMMKELKGLKENCIVTPFVGHCGRSGLEITPDGKKIIHSGRGIGNNYWDLLPMGYKDAYATIHYYDSLNDMAKLEREIDKHPEWNMPGGPLEVKPEQIEAHAQNVKEYSGKLFWNEDTGRFVCSIDIDGKAYDYGFTFINCEAIAYDFATEEQAESIMEWLSGDRIVESDTSRGDDIYHWRFGPRSTTKRNVEYYGWFWSNPESIPWGGQVQDGGAVLGFSYHDLLSRIKILGPDNAWQRLKEVIAWFDEVQDAGGYREYYKDESKGTLQGGGRAGGLGLDHEFFESILVPQIMINGFMGLKPKSDGLFINPQLPEAWPSLTITRIYHHQAVFDITAINSSIDITLKEGKLYKPFYIYLSGGEWQLNYINPDGTKSHVADVNKPEKGIEVDLWIGRTINLTQRNSL